MKKILPLLFLAATLSGASVDFRGGKVLCAELSTRCPAGVKLDPILYPESELPENKVYATLTVLYHPGRTLSPLDYCIELGVNYPCIAIREENKSFSADVKKVYRGSAKTKYTLLFILNRNFLSSSGREKLYLKANFPPEQRSKQQIEFRMLGDKPFTAPGAVPVSGLMPEK